ncbi:MAG: iron ABC transporter permease [Planctomycetota bacterium]|nr:MAG: iron ABC transporter permease [Planctomycetota bacterium]
MKTLTVKRWLVTIIIMAVVLAVLMFFCQFVGAKYVGPEKIITGLSRTDSLILLHYHLPRVLVAALVGAALAVCGAVFQGLLRNPLADPFILGISGGGTVGAVFAVAIGANVALFGLSAVTVFAFLGSLGALALVLAFSKIRGTVATHTLILAGVVLNAIFSAVILFLMSMMSVFDMRAIYRWLMGSLSYSIDLEYSQIGVAAGGVVVCSILLLTTARSLNLFALGEESAVQMGVRAERTRLFCLILTAILTGVAVSVTGPIGFVGLIVPHIVRLLVGPDHRIVLPASFFGGAIFLLVADAVARSVLPLTGLSLSELPVGVVTALCGGPFFLWLLRSRSKRAVFGR